LLTPLVKTGDQLFGHAITGLNLGQFGLDASGTRNIAFDYTLDNGVSGVALASAVPEAPQWLVLGAVAVGALGVRTAFRRRTVGRPASDSYRQLLGRNDRDPSICKGELI